MRCSSPRADSSCDTESAQSRPRAGPSNVAATPSARAAMRVARKRRSSCSSASASAPRTMTMVATARSDVFAPLRLAKELADHLDDALRIADEEQMIDSGQLRVLRTGDVGGELAARLDVDQDVVRAMNDERRHANGGQHAADVDAAVHPHQRDAGAGGRAEPLELAPPADHVRVLAHGGGEQRQALAAPPVALDVVEQALQRRLVGMPVLELREAAVDDERVAALGMVGGEQRRERAAFGDAHHVSGLEPGRVHHRAQVVHALVHRRQRADRIG